MRREYSIKPQQEIHNHHVLFYNLVMLFSISLYQEGEYNFFYVQIC